MGAEAAAELPFKAAQYIESAAAGFSPEYCIVLGSGLADLTDLLADQIVIPYRDVPGFNEPKSPGHIGELVRGQLGGKKVAVFRGKVFSHEAAGASCMTVPIRAMHLMGVHTLFYTASSGSTDPAADVGDLVLVTDHINFLGVNPLVGDNDERFGPRYPSLENCYDIELRQALQHIAADHNIKLVEGVYGAMRGPAFETAAEIRSLKLAGVLAVGMSLVPEALLARHCGMKVLALANITNMAVGMSDVPITHEQTLEGARSVMQKLQVLLPAFLASTSRSQHS